MSSRSGGIEVMGQRMIFGGAYLLMTVVALAPAAVLGLLAFLLGRWLGNFEVAAALAALFGGATLAVEMMTIVWWLGERVERFDLSLESPRQ
jgi:predicted LPLAT superfamily acyltransferase